MESGAGPAAAPDWPQLDWTDDEPPPEHHWLDDPPTVGAVIVAHNGAHWLPKVLNSFSDMFYAPTAWCAVDVGSTDGGAELLGPETATTVHHAEGGQRVVVDGPFSEAKENIGGFSVIDVPDIDAAIALVKTWPMLELPGNSVEIRPMVVDYSHLES
jgi:hypothetical protein